MFGADKHPMGKIVLAVCILFLVVGCSKASKLYRKTADLGPTVKSSEKNRLKKKIGFVFFENRTGYSSQNLEGMFRDRLAAHLAEECAEVLLIQPEHQGFPGRLLVLPRQPSGRVDNFQLAVTAKEFGFNAIVTGSLHSIKETQEEKGVLWFKDIHNMLRTHIALQILDSQSGAKLLDEVFSHEIEMDQLESELPVSSTAFDQKVFATILSELADTVGKSICKVIEDEPWRGFVVASAGTSLKLSAGSQVGIQSGTIFDIYSRGDMVEGKNGQRFFMPGKRTGAVEITAVSPRTSEAKLISGSYEGGRGGYVQPE
jgi:hypothetical protein